MGQGTGQELDGNRARTRWEWAGNRTDTGVNLGTIGTPAQEVLVNYSGTAGCDGGIL